MNKYYLVTALLFGTLTGDVFSQEDLPQLIENASEAVVALSWQTNEKPRLDRDLLHVLTPEATPATGGKLVEAPKFLLRTSDLQTTFASGVLIAGDGTLVGPGPSTLTDDVTDIQVVLHNGHTHPAKRLVVDRRSDLTILKIDTDQVLHHVRIAEEEPKIGQFVFGVYRPLDKGPTAAVGIVSAKKRIPGSSPQVLLQTDLLVGAGSSGSPVLNKEGDVVGFIVSKIGGNGTSFAIPARHAQRALESKGTAADPVTIKKPYMGVALNKTDSGEIGVHAVLAGAGADKAGMKVGDVILAVDEATDFEAIEDVIRAVEQFDVNEEIRVKIRRGEEEYELPVTLHERNEKNLPLPKAKVNQFVPAQILYTDPAAGPEGAVGELFPLRLPNADSVAPTLRVQRSGLDKRVEDLGKEIRRLQIKLDQLSETMSRLEGRLQPAPR